VKSRLPGLLKHRPVVRASTFGGLAGLVLHSRTSRRRILRRHGAGGDYHVFSMWLSLLLRTQSSRSVKRLLELQPGTARLVRDGVEGNVPLRAVGVGDHAWGTM